MHVLQLIKNNKPRVNRLGLTRKGFTLVELIVVIAVMAVLLAVLAPSLLNYVEDSRAQKDDSAMIEVVAGIKSSMDSDPDVYDEMYRLAQFIEEEDVYISMHKDTDGSGFTPHVLGKPLEETAPALAQKIKGLVDEPYKVSSATYKDMVYNIYLHRDGDLEIRNVFGKWESEIKINIPTGTPVMPDNSKPNVDHPDRPDTDIPDTDYEPPVPDNPGLGGGGYTKPTAPTTPDPDKTVASFTPPVAISPLSYTGNPQTLIIPGQTNDGTMYYRVGGVSWSTDLPEATAAGTYNVEYYVKGDSTHTDSPIGTVRVVIDKINASVVAPQGKVMGYTGTEQTLIIAGSVSGEGTLQYSMDEKTWSTALPTAKDIGDYKVFYRVAGTASVNNSNSGYVISKIQSRDQSVTVVPASGLIWTGVEYDLIISGTATGGTLYYSVNGGTESTTRPKASEVGTYNITYYSKGDANHDDTLPETITVVIAKAIAEDKDKPVIVGEQWNYDGTEHTIQVNPNGWNVKYSTTGTTGPFSSSIPSRKDVGMTVINWEATNPHYLDSNGVVSLICNTNELHVNVVDGNATYTGAATDGGAKVIITSNAPGATVEYGTTPGIYTLDTMPKFINAGTHTVFYQITAPNYDTKTGALTISIKKDLAALDKPEGKTLDWTGMPQELCTAGNTDSGTIMYSLNGTSQWSDTVPTATDAGTYIIYFKVFGDANHEDSSIDSVTTTINKASNIMSRDKVKQFTRTNTPKSIIFTLTQPVPTNAVNVSEKTNGGIRAWMEDDTMYIANIYTGENVKAPDDLQYLFGVTGNNDPFAANIESVDFTALDTSDTTDIHGLFLDCINLKSVNMNMLNVSNVIEMNDVFSNCKSLASLDLSNWDTSSAQDMNDLFSYCESLQTLNLSNWKTSNVIDMHDMFYYCKSLQTLDVSNWNTANVTDMSCMFYHCESLNNLDLSSFKTPQLQYMSEMFAHCRVLNNLNIQNMTTSNVTTMASTFYKCYELTNLDVSRFDTKNVTSFNKTFGHCEKLSSLAVSNWDTSSAINMADMFYHCNILESLDVSNFKTGNVTTMEQMFRSCEKLPIVEVNNWDVSKVTTMAYMFTGCLDIKNIDASSWNTASLLTTRSMFYECLNLSVLNMSGWNTSKVTDMHNMFFRCEKLPVIDVSHFDTRSVTDMHGMFEECRMVKNLNVSGFDTANVTDMSHMFTSCPELTYMDVSNFNTSKVESLEKFMHYDWKLTRVDIPYDNCNGLKNTATRMYGKDETVYYDFNDTDNTGDIITNLDETLSVQRFKEFGRTNNPTAIVFTSSKNNPDGTDVSEALNKSITAWMEDTTMYVASSTLGKNVNAPKSLRYAMGIDLESDTNDDWIRNITYIDTSALDTSNTTDMSYLFAYCSSAATINVSNLTTNNVEYAQGMFMGCNAVTSLDVSHFNTSKMVYTYYMFYGCEKITSLDINTWDMSKVTTATQMFRDCFSLIMLDLSNWTMPKLEYANSMFNSCEELVILDISNLNPSNLKDGSYMFVSCYKLTNLDLSKWTLTELTDMAGMFCECYSLQSVDLRGFSTQNTTRMPYLFQDCMSMTTLLFETDKFTTSNVTEMQYMFYGCEVLTSLDVSNFDTSKVVNMEGMFASCKLVPVLDVSNWNVSLVKKMNYMFSYCSNVSVIDISKWTNTVVTEMEGAFFHCDSIEVLDLQGFNTYNVTDFSHLCENDSKLKTFLINPDTFLTDNAISMRQMFYDCRELESLNTSNWHTDNVTDLALVFTLCQKLGEIDVSRWNTSNVVTLEGTFTNCESITVLDVSNWDTSNVTNMTSTFLTCVSLSELDVSNWNTKKVTTTNSIFAECYSLTSLDLSSWETDNNTNMRCMFYSDTDLKTITIPVWNTQNVETMEDLYARCSSLEDIYYAGTRAQWDEMPLTDDDIYSTGNYIIHYLGESPIVCLDKEYNSVFCPMHSVVATFSDGTGLTWSELKLEENGTKYRYNASAITDENIGDFAFFMNNNLTSIIIPSNVTNVGEMAFHGCDNLTDVNILNGLTTIGDNAFSVCRNITSINIPSSVTNMGVCVFNGCTGLTKINVDSKNPTYKSIDGVLFSKDGTTIIAYPIGKTDTRYVIPSSVTTIGDYIFQNCTNLTSITIPSSVTNIGYYAFASCTNLNNIFYPGTTAEWNAIAFDADWNTSTNNYIVHCENACISKTGSTLTNCPIHQVVIATYSDGTKLTFRQLQTASSPYVYDKSKITTSSFGEYAFRGCTKLTSIKVPEGVTSMDGHPFWNCSNLKTIQLPDGIKTFGSRPFWNCSSLTSVNIPGSVTDMGSFTFDGCTSLKNLVISEGVTKISSFAFSYSSLENIEFPNTLKDLGSFAFNYCDSLTNIEIPNSIITIGAYAFDGCNFPNITLPNSVTNIGAYAFTDASNTTNITIPNSVVKIGQSAFQNCTSLTSITIPSSVTSIYYNAFNDCSKLTAINVDVNNLNYTSENGVLFNKDKTTLLVYPAGKTGTYTIPNSVTSIGTYAFYGCSELTSITMPNSVTSIGNYNFRNCTKLTAINVDESNPSYTSENGVLFDKEKTTLMQYPTGKTDSSYTIPDSVTSIGTYAFYKCTSLTSITIPNSVTNIVSYALANCTKLVNIYYNGTQAQWNAITKGSSWDSNTGDYTINCTDGLLCKTHTYGEGIVTKTPTCTETGTELQTCSVCGYINEVIIPPQHSFVNGICSICGICDGKSFNSAITATVGNYTATIASDNYVHNNKKIAIYKFVAPETKTYIFQGTGSTDTYGYLFNSSQSQIAYDDDSGSGSQFKISYSCTAGETYYLGVAFYSSGTGNIPFSIS